MARHTDEGTDALRAAYENLTKAGQGSLHAAYAFGQIVDALTGVGYTYGMLGEMIGRSGSMVSMYAKLYRKYPNVQTLVHLAEEMSTYDVSRLASDTKTVRYAYAWQCQHCGTVGEVRKIRQLGEDGMPARADGAARVTA